MYSPDQERQHKVAKLEKVGRNQQRENAKQENENKTQIALMYRREKNKQRERVDHNVRVANRVINVQPTTPKIKRVMTIVGKQIRVNISEMIDGSPHKSATNEKQNDVTAHYVMQPQQVLVVQHVRPSKHQSESEKVRHLGKMSDHHMRLTIS